MPSPPCIGNVNIMLNSKKFRKRRARDRARIMEIVAINLASGTTPHPLLLDYVRGKIQEVPKIASKRVKTKKKTNFYQSSAWRKLRYETLVKYGAKCQACGTTKGPFDVDHIKPRSKYPKLQLDPKNTQVLCTPCNAGKSNRSAEDWR